MRTKTPDTYYINSSYTNVQKFMKSTSNSEQTVITKSTERQKSSFPKEQLENTDLHKPLLNKIMTTQD